MVRIKESFTGLSVLFKYGLFAVLSVVALASCGGGSKGTGADQVYGYVLTTTRQPVPNAVVTDVKSGNSVRTDGEGSFRLQGDFDPGDLHLGVDTESFSTTVTITGVPSVKASINCVITLDEDNEEGEVSEIEITEEEEEERNEHGTPVPTRTPRATVSPTPKPTAALPSATESPVPTPEFPSSASPSPSPSATPRDGKEYEVTGVITAITNSSITVKEIEFIINSLTEISRESSSESIATLSVGMRVSVHGRAKGGQIIAKEIEIRS